MPRRRGKDAIRASKRHSTGTQREQNDDEHARSRNRPTAKQKLQQGKQGLTAHVGATPRATRRRKRALGR